MQGKIGGLGLLLGALLLGCGSDEGSDDEGCTADIDCKGDRICEDGVCTYPSNDASISSGGEGGGGGSDEAESSLAGGGSIERTDGSSAAGDTGGEGGTSAEGLDLCLNTCAFAFDSDCDDCGPGSDYSFCDIGTDCADCGPRTSTDSCVSDSDPGSGGSSGGSTTCRCNCSCSGCSAESTRTCSGPGNTDCTSCEAICRELCSSDPNCGFYRSSSGTCS